MWNVTAIALGLCLVLSGCAKKADQKKQEAKPAKDEVAKTGAPTPAETPAKEEVAQEEAAKVEPVAAKKAEPEAKSAKAEPEVGDWDEDDILWNMDTTLLASAKTSPKGDGEEAAFGTLGGNGTAEVWAQLGTYQASYLKTWKGAFGDSGSANDVVDAFNELAFAVTGPTGFWRDTLPKKWLGCENNQESEPCVQLGKALPELEKWDSVQKKLSNMSEKKAAKFLNRNRTRMLTYFEHYVPQDTSASAMKATGFYKAHLEGVLPD